MQVYAQTYTDDSNPFVSGSAPGSCQYPQITVGGLLDGFSHGRDIWALYGPEKLGLLPPTPNRDKVWLRSSSSPLTQDTAGAVLRGIWPEYTLPVALHQQQSSVDTVNEGFSCPAQSQVLDAIKASDSWNDHLSATKPLRDSLATMFDASSDSWMSTFDHFCDNFQARLCNGYRLPCSRRNQSQCVTQSQADEVFRAGDWEWNYYWRTNANVTQYIQLVEGLFIKEIVNRLQTVASGRSDLVFSLTFIHDGDLGPILGALGISRLRWPGMGSNISFELWYGDHVPVFLRKRGPRLTAVMSRKTSDGSHYARVLYSGHPVKSVHGTLDWISLSTLIDILTPFIPNDIVSMCQQ